MDIGTYRAAGPGQPKIMSREEPKKKLLINKREHLVLEKIEKLCVSFNFPKMTSNDPPLTPKLLDLVLPPKIQVNYSNESTVIH